MKTHSTLICLALLTAGAWSYGAEPKNEASQPKPAPEAKVKPPTSSQPRERYVLLTGSLIPQRVRIDGPISDGCNPVSVISRKDINESGASTVGHLLRRSGYGR